VDRFRHCGDARVCRARTPTTDNRNRKKQEPGRVGRAEVVSSVAPIIADRRARRTRPVAIVIRRRHGRVFFTRGWLSRRRARSCLASGPAVVAFPPAAAPRSFEHASRSIAPLASGCSASNETSHARDARIIAQVWRCRIKTRIFFQAPDFAGRNSRGVWDTRGVRFCRRAQRVAATQAPNRSAGGS
jgi:hypothetical protein